MASAEAPFLTPDDILGTLAKQCAPHGPVHSVSLFCRADCPGQLLGMVHMETNAAAAAAALGRAFVTGDDVCTVVPVGPEFHCVQRTSGRMLVPDCNTCRRRA